MIIYDKCDLAKEAMTLLERVAHRTDESMQWSVKPWRADLLRQSPTAEAALAEAAEAHLILLALRPVHALLPWLVDWLVRWAKCRRVQDAALAVWEGGNTDTSAERAAPELLQFTGRYGLSLIFDDNPMVQDKSSRFASGLPEREVSLTPTLQNNLEQPARDYYQHWGINE